MSRSAAIALAAKYGLEDEVTYCIDVLGMFPEDAIYEWDIM